MGDLQYQGGGWGWVGGCKGLFRGCRDAATGADAAPQETMSTRGENPRNT